MRFHNGAVECLAGKGSNRTVGCDGSRPDVGDSHILCVIGNFHASPVFAFFCEHLQSLIDIAVARHVIGGFFMIKNDGIALV